MLGVDKNTVVTLYSGLMPPVEMPAGTQPQINMTSHSMVDIPPAVLHNSTSSLDTTSATSSIVDSNHRRHVIGFLDNFVMEEQLLEHQPPLAHVAVESFYTPGMKPSC